MANLSEHVQSFIREAIKLEIRGRAIADEERFHYDLLQTQYDSVTGSGFWLDSAEFQMDGKY